jgi:Glutaredoxin-like domain (DUF836)
MAFGFLKRWFRRSPVQRPDLHLIFYTRERCHLCLQAWQLLERYQSQYGFTLEAKNVDQSPEWTNAFGNWVPVVAINGKVRFKGHVNEVLLRRVLEFEPEA